ncbi:MAG: hypothetical protein CL623_08185 [Arcobacter sp.]|nr:hypothetical protein [Arcobacter sp.]
MKLINYKLQTQMEYLSDSKSIKFFKEYLQTILEDTSKPYYQRADYIGLSLQELKSKIDILNSDISELQSLKKKLATSLDLAKEITAQILIENGIDRIDGNVISSLTVTKESSKEKRNIKIKDSNSVMGLGFVKFEVDLEDVEKAIDTKEGLVELSEFIEISNTTVVTPSKIKVNAKKLSKDNDSSITDEILTLQTAA